MSPRAAYPGYTEAGHTGHTPRGGVAFKAVDLPLGLIGAHVRSQLVDALVNQELVVFINLRSRPARELHLRLPADFLRVIPKFLAEEANKLLGQHVAFHAVEALAAGLAYRLQAIRDGFGVTDRGDNRHIEVENLFPPGRALSVCFFCFGKILGLLGASFVSELLLPDLRLLVAVRAQLLSP